MTAKKATTAPKSQSQKDKFMAMAKELGNTTELAFNKVLKRVGRAKPSTRSPAKPKS
jgi:hypothetical protein